MPRDLERVETCPYDEAIAYLLLQPETADVKYLVRPSYAVHFVSRRQRTGAVGICVGQCWESSFDRRTLKTCTLDVIGWAVLYVMVEPDGRKMHGFVRCKLQARTGTRRKTGRHGVVSSFIRGRGK